MITPEKMQEYKKAWGEPAFVFCAGRYYYGMWCVHIPAHKGVPEGDLTLLLWRFQETPNKWAMTYRFRWYAGPDPDDQDDKRSWYAVSFESDDEAHAIKAAEFLTREASGFAQLGSLKKSEIGFLKICGDSDAFGRAVQEQKPSWLHMSKRQPPPIAKA